MADGQGTQPAAQVHSHYDAIAEDYSDQYRKEALLKRPRYPGNYFRLQLLLNSFVEKGVKRVIEVGVGEGTPLSTLARAGVDVWGFDISQKMVEKSRETVQQLGISPDRIFWGDIQDPITYSHSLRDGQFDGLMAMGVMPHIENDDMVLRNMAAMVRPGGSVFIEFRNKLFSLFTFNRYTYEFIMDDLLSGVAPEVRDVVSEELKQRVRMDVPAVRATTESGSGPGYDVILSRFHNPFEVPALFERHGFKEIKLLWYHYHPAMPMLESQIGERFRTEAFRMEHEPSGWKGYFLCSAFVIEAVKG